MEKFSIIIIEFTTKENLHPSEQLYIDLLLPAYNLNKIVGRQYIGPLNIKPISDEQKFAHQNLPPHILRDVGPPI